MEPALHYIIPVFALLTLFPTFCKRIKYKWVLLLGILSFLPDIDHLTNLHRSLFHNIFFVVLLGLIILFFLGKNYGLLSFYFLGSHLLFDLSRYGIALLWPFYKNLMGFEISLILYKAEGFKFIFDFFIESPIVMEKAVASGYLYPIGALILILVGILIFIKFITFKLNRIML